MTLRSCVQREGIRRFVLPYFFFFPRLGKRFVTAARTGDLVGLLRILDPNVTFRADGGGSGWLARPAVHGAEDVARQSTIFGPRFAGYARESWPIYWRTWSGQHVRSCWPVWSDRPQLTRWRRWIPTSWRGCCGNHLPSRLLSWSRRWNLMKPWTHCAI